MPTKTISTLENELAKLNSQPRTKAINGQIQALEREISQQKQFNKAAAWKLEQNNFQYLVFYDSDKGYKKLIGNSALIYAANIAKRLGRRANLREDTDHYTKSAEGVVSVVLDEKMELTMNALGIKKIAKLSTDYLNVYKLPNKFTEDDIKQFREILQKDSREINKILLPKSPMPILFNHLKDLVEIVYYNSNSMPLFAKQTLGTNLMTKVNEMLSVYIKFANDNEKASTAYKELYRLTVELKTDMKTVEILHLMSSRNICRLLEQLVMIEKLTNKLLRAEINKHNGTK